MALRGYIWGIACGVAAAASPLMAQDNAAIPDRSEALVPGAEIPVEADSPAKPEQLAEKVTDKNHPDFVRCRSEPVLGSRASRVRVCRTNREWEMAARGGNRDAVELMNSGRPLQPLP
ncbi:MAG: hypothetical protein ACXIT4_05390 [Erythrobacter sp.]